MRFLQILIAALLLLVGAGLWLHHGVQRAEAETSAFCNVTRLGEPLPQLRRRAAEHGLSFEKQNTPNGQPEAYVASAEAMSRRFGCTLELRDGRVADKRAGELPRD